ncbi:MAG: hypothetical protein HOY79_17755 [Streptomyces sp.]|nr:hypothetical protein [Streptomyces sp.]
MHFHAYTSRVPGHLANGSPESEPGTAKTSLGDKAEYIPTAGLGDFYRSTHPPRVTRRWLLRDPKLIGATCTTADEAAEWLGRWIQASPRRDGSYFPGESWETELSQSVEYARGRLAGGCDVVKGFYTPGGEYLSATLIACPPRDGEWKCPQGHAS